MCAGAPSPAAVCVAATMLDAVVGLTKKCSDWGNYLIGGLDPRLMILAAARLKVRPWTRMEKRTTT